MCLGIEKRWGRKWNFLVLKEMLIRFEGNIFDTTRVFNIFGYLNAK